MIEHNVKIITDITEYKNYVDSKYGKKFIKSCKVRQYEIYKMRHN